jgi:hypothetical protein
VHAHSLLSSRADHAAPQDVNLGSFEAVQSYLGNVPPTYHRYIRRLSICTKSAADPTPGTAPATRELISQQCRELLAQCGQVEQLTLSLVGSLDKAVISCFESLDALRVLSVNHCGDENKSPLYVYLDLHVQVTS